MSSELKQAIDVIALFNTHEHMVSEQYWTGARYDILRDLFENYIRFDLIAGGASEKEVYGRLVDPEAGTIASRFGPFEQAWKHLRLTGYGESVELAAKRVFLMSEVTVDTLESADKDSPALHRPGERLRLLRDVARCDHVQVDDFQLTCDPDRSGPDFFLYDISWWRLSCGDIDVWRLLETTGVEVRDLKSLRTALQRVFERHGATAIAVKSQHAYNRTLEWQERSDGQAARSLEIVLKENENLEPKSEWYIQDGRHGDLDARLCLGDWCLARGVEMATKHGLPIKLHTGHCASNNLMRIEDVDPSRLSPLFRRYPEARFCLMHIGFPFDNEVMALAKHYSNVWVDMCWAWSSFPVSSKNFLRKWIHSVPLNKLFGYGGDSRNPIISVGYAEQMRRWLGRALKEEIEEGWLSEKQAIGVANAVLTENQRAFFDLAGTRAAIRQRLGQGQRR